MNSRFSGRSGFGSWFGKRPVGLEVARTASIGSRSSTGGSIAPAIPFAASITTFSGLIAATSTNESTFSTNSCQMFFAVACAAARRRPERLQRAVADVEQARLAAHRQRAAADDLHPRVLLRVVRGGDADAAVEPELADREVDHLRADHARGRARRRRRRRRRRSRAADIEGEESAHVAADGDPPRLEVLDVGAPDRVRALLVELVRIDAADVVGLEHLRVEHGAMLWGALGLTPVPKWRGAPRASAPRRLQRSVRCRIQSAGVHVARVDEAGLLVDDDAPDLGRVREHAALRGLDGIGRSPAGRSTRPPAAASGSTGRSRGHRPSTTTCTRSSRRGSCCG